jgi:putative acetyltransferase
MENLAIRKVLPADNLILAALIRSVFEEHHAPQQNSVYSDPTTDDLYTFFLHPGSVLWVALINDTIVGCCGIYPTEALEAGCAELVKFYLLPQARGKGIGKQLMLLCFQSAKEFGYKKIYLESFPSFSAAIGMYEKLGFTRLSKPLGNSGHTACNVWMIKDIAELTSP